MAQRWKTFSANSTLPASDVNDCLNPSTADHLARSVAAGQAGVPAPANSYGNLRVNFPSGRFSQAPIVTATLASSSNSVLGGMSINVTSVTTSGMDLRINNNTSTGFSSLDVNWIAVQI